MYLEMPSFVISTPNSLQVLITSQLQPRLKKGISGSFPLDTGRAGHQMLHQTSFMMPPFGIMVNPAAFEKSCIAEDVK